MAWAEVFGHFLFLEEDNMKLIVGNYFGTHGYPDVDRLYLLFPLLSVDFPVVDNRYDRFPGHRTAVHKFHSGACFVPV